MPLGVPNLDQITQTLDSISSSLDTDADLLKVEYNNPNLEQLDGWGVKYHSVKLGKPHYDLFIDDRSINNEAWYEKENIKI